jgi:hypothetical protein
MISIRRTTLMKDKFRNIRFGIEEEDRVFSLADRLGISLGTRGAYSRIVRFAICAASLWAVDWTPVPVQAVLDAMDSETDRPPTEEELCPKNVGP